MLLTTPLNRTSGDVENRCDERFDVMLGAAEDAERQRRHHDDQAAHDYRGRFSYSS